MGTMAYTTSPLGAAVMELRVANHCNHKQNTGVSPMETLKNSAMRAKEYLMKKRYLFGFIVVLLALAMMFYGCGLLPSDPDPNTNLISFTVTPNQPSEGENTGSLGISFSAAVTGLTADNITISEAKGSEVQKGNLSGSGQNYTLDITLSGFGGPVSCSVKISKEGVSSSAIPVSGIVNRKDPADFRLDRVSNIANGAAKVLITLTKDVTLVKDQIHITSGRAAVGALSSVENSKTKYELTLNDAIAGTITIKIINNTQVTTAERELLLQDATTTNPPTQQGPITQISIRPDTSQYYSLLLNSTPATDKPVEVEVGYNRKFSTDVVPVSSNPASVNWLSFDTSVATVLSEFGKTTDVKGIWPGQPVTIVARSPDGTVGALYSLKTVGRITPTKLDVKISSEFSTEVSTDSEANGTKETPKDVTLKLGDNTMQFSTVLRGNYEAKTNKRTNDQAVFITWTSSPKISITPNDRQESTIIDTDKEETVPGWLHKLMPNGVTGDTPVLVRIQADNAPNVAVWLNVKVEYTKLISTDVTFSYLQADKVSIIVPNPNTSFDGVKFVGSENTIFVKIETEKPASIILASNMTGGIEKFATLSGPLEGSTEKTKWYSVVKKPNDAFPNGGVISLMATVTDYNDSSLKVTREIKIGGSGYNFN
jgi:hypothetical protein